MVIIYVVLIAAASFWLGWFLRRGLELHWRRAEEAAEARARQHRAGQLREFGRIHDIREDASGEPAIVRPMRVLGKSPRHKPPTRM